MIRRLIILALALAGATWLLRKGYEVGVQKVLDDQAKERKAAYDDIMAHSRQIVEDAKKWLADHEPTDGEAVDGTDTHVDREPDEYENFSFNSTTPAPATPPEIFYGPWQR